MSFRLALGVWLGALGVMIAALVGCFLAVPHARLGDSVPVGTLAGVERRTDLRFPSGSQLQEARYVYGGFGGSSLYAVVTMPPEQARNYLAGPSFEGQSSTERSLNDKAASWAGLTAWRPDRARKFLSASGKDPGSSRWAHVLVDLERPDVATLYLEWALP